MYKLIEQEKLYIIEYNDLMHELNRGFKRYNCDSKAIAAKIGVSPPIPRKCIDFYEQKVSDTTLSKFAHFVGVPLYIQHFNGEKIYLINAKYFDDGDRKY